MKWRLVLTLDIILITYIILNTVRWMQCPDF